MENNNSRMVSRHSSYSSVPASSRGRREQPQSQQPQPPQQPQQTGLRCNRCHKTLATTVFVCKCDCVFCEECTYQHFNQSSSCPACHATLGAEDFMELCIADPTTASQEASKNSFQDMLTKYKQGSPMLTHHDMLNRLLQSHDDHRLKIKFLIRQVVNDVRVHGQRSINVARINQNLTQELTQVKQAASSQRIQYDQTLADMQNRLSAMTVAMQEKDKQVQEKDKQITQFRQHYASEGMARLPSSSNSINSYGSNSNGGRRTRPRSTDGSNDMTMGPPSFHHQQQQQQQQEQQPPPPIQGFVQQKEARERAKEQALAQMTRSRGPFQPMNNNTLAANHHINSSISSNNNNNMMMMSATPIVLPPGVRPSSSGSGGSSVLGSGRVRDIRAVSTNNFSFGSRSSHQHQQQHQTRAPSTAFAFNQGSNTSSGYRPSISSSNNNSRRSNGYGGGRR